MTRLFQFGENVWDKFVNIFPSPESLLYSYSTCTFLVFVVAVVFNFCADGDLCCSGMCFRNTDL